jgi:hypothetical protein
MNHLNLLFYDSNYLMKDGRNDPRSSTATYRTRKTFADATFSGGLSGWDLSKVTSMLCTPPPSTATHVGLGRERDQQENTLRRHRL